MSAAPGTFEFAQVEETARIPWLNGPNAKGLAAVFGRSLDTEATALKAGTKMRCPLEAPADALPYLARDRSMFRPPIFNDEEFAAHLDGAHDWWYWGGAPAAIVNVFRPYGYDETTCHVLNDWQTSFPGGPWFSRVLILLDQGHWGPDGLWDDDGSYDDGGLWDSDMRIEEADYIRRSIRSTKAPGAYPVVVCIILAADGDGFWDTTPSWYDDGGDWTDTPSTVMYLTIGHTWEEEVWTGGSDGAWDSPGVYMGFEPPSGGW